jgi:hypothetical protein
MEKYKAEGKLMSEGLDAVKNAMTSRVDYSILGEL